MAGASLLSPVCEQEANVCFGSWLCENSEARIRDRTNISSKPRVQCAKIERVFSSDQSEKNILFAFQFLRFYTWGNSGIEPHHDARAMLMIGRTALARGLPLDQYAFPDIGGRPLFRQGVLTRGLYQKAVGYSYDRLRQRQRSSCFDRPAF